MTDPRKAESGVRTADVEDAESALAPWLSERVKDAQILRQEIAVTLIRLVEDREVPVFSDRFDPAKDAVAAFVRELLGAAMEACHRQPGRNRFVVRIKGDSRQKRFTLHAGNVADGDLEGRDRAMARATDEPHELRTTTGDERQAWIRFAAAAVSNTAQFTKAAEASERDKPKKPGTSRSFTMIAPDTVASYAARVADEMLLAYRARWKK